MKKKKTESYFSFIKKHDKAARNNLQIFFTYPGFKAVAYYRISNFLFRHHLKLLAEIITFHARKKTGIEIHPAAKIGRNLFIDHGFGVVIGSDSVIEDNVVIYHGVTLGAKGTERLGEKRHPTIKSGALIGAGSIILGDVTIGEGAIIGAGSLVTKDVEAHTTFVQKRR